jgi:hypothetical protein
MFVDDFERDLERYCDQVLARVSKEHGKPSQVTVSWSPAGGLWARAFELGWSACVDGEWHEHDWGDALPLKRVLPYAPLRKLRAAHPDCDGFFAEDERDALESENEADEDDPPGEFGRWLTMMLDEAMLEVASRVAKKPACKGVAFAISGHDDVGPDVPKDNLSELKQLRDDAGYMPTQTLLRAFFAMCTKDAARSERWLSFAKLGAPVAKRSAALPKWRTFEMLRLAGGKAPKWYVHVDGTVLHESVATISGTVVSYEKHVCRSRDAVYAKASELIAEREKLGYFAESMEPEPRLALLRAAAKRCRAKLQLMLVFNRRDEVLGLPAIELFEAWRASEDKARAAFTNLLLCEAHNNGLFDYFSMLAERLSHRQGVHGNGGPKPAFFTSKLVSKFVREAPAASKPVPYAPADHRYVGYCLSVYKPVDAGLPGLTLAALHWVLDVPQTR